MKKMPTEVIETGYPLSQIPTNSVFRLNYGGSDMFLKTQHGIVQIFLEGHTTLQMGMTWTDSEAENLADGFFDFKECVPVKGRNGEVVTFTRLYLSEKLENLVDFDPYGNKTKSGWYVRLWNYLCSYFSDNMKD